MKKIKKVLASLLAATMVISMGLTAFAEESETVTGTMASKAKVYSTDVKKIYTVTGASRETLFPTETLQFTSIAQTTNPDGGEANLSIAPLVVSGNTDQMLEISLPSFTKVGTYHFEIEETTGVSQGVGYTNDKIAVSVLVTYDYDDEDQDDHLMTATVGITRATGTNDAGETTTTKVDTFTNTYDVGSLAVTKNVTGKLGDTSKYFKVNVKFKTETGKFVESDIVIVGGSFAGDPNKNIPANPTIIDAADNENAKWTGEKDVDIYLKSGETITFKDIPAGVTYEVVEDPVYATGDKNSENGYEEAQYTFSDALKAIASNDNDTVVIVNQKDTNVDTGIILDSAPYMILLAFAAMGVLAVVAKKRKEEF